MKRVTAVFLVGILVLGFSASVQGLAAGLVREPEGSGVDQSLDQVGRFALQDGIPYCETAPGDGLHEVGGQAPLCVRNSNNPCPRLCYGVSSPRRRLFFPLRWATSRLRPPAPSSGSPTWTPLPRLRQTQARRKSLPIPLISRPWCTSSPFSPLSNAASAAPDETARNKRGQHRPTVHICFFGFNCKFFTYI